MERIIKCKICGCDVVATVATKKYCVECANNLNREKAKEYQRKNKINNKQADEKAKKQVKKMIPKSKKPTLSIYEVVNLASKAGMSYGQYVSKMEGDNNVSSKAYKNRII